MNESRSTALESQLGRGAERRAAPLSSCRDSRRLPPRARAGGHDGHGQEAGPAPRPQWSAVRLPARCAARVAALVAPPPRAPPSPIQPYFFCSPMYVSDSKYPSQVNLCPSHLPSQNLSHASATSRRRASARPLRALSKLCDLLSLWCMCVRVCPIRPGMVNLAPTSTGSATAIAEVTPGGQPGPGSGPGPEPGPAPP